MNPPARLTTTGEQMGPITARLLEATSSTTGQDAFLAMARAITEAFGVRWAFVGELITPSRVRTRAGWSRGEALPVVEYDLEGTPCADVLWQDACGFPSGVQQRFPRDHMLVEMGAESYFGVPVFDRHRKPIGIIVALHDEPLDVGEYRPLLHLFAMRVGAEFEREHAERLLRQNERLEGLSMLASGVAHDFNNLLTVIMANVDFARRHLTDSRPEEAAPLLLEVERAAKAAAGLTRQLLAYSGKAEARFERIDLRALVRETAKMIAPLLPERALLHFELPDDLPPVRGDMTQLRQVVMNLLRNAGDALIGRDGSIAVTARLLPPDAPEYAKTALQAEDFDAGEPHVAVTFADTGTGIGPEIRDRLFVPFTTTKAAGHGFGLAITARVLGRHRGAIVVESKRGSGTSMTVLLPIASPDADAPARAASDAAPFAGARVLVADDEPQVRSTMVRALRRLGCEVVEVGDGEAALRLLRRTPAEVDCAMLDLFMPGLGGDDVALALHGDSPRLPIVLTSGLLPDEMEHHLRSGTVAAALSKPWTSEDLASALRAALPARART